MCNVIFGIIPGFKAIPVVIRSILVPFLISRFLMTKLLDGKNPIRYAIGLVTFLFGQQGKVTEHFSIQAIDRKPIRLIWNCSEGVEDV